MAAGISHADKYELIRTSWLSLPKHHYCLVGRLVPSGRDATTSSAIKAFSEQDFSHSANQDRVGAMASQAQNDVELKTRFAEQQHQEGITKKPL